MSLTALISNISRGSLHDGKGIRTVVYFKGCNLRCRWCHNPEALSRKKDILYAPVKCIGCGKCASVCPEHHGFNGKEHTYFRKDCRRCGSCAEICPTGALSVCGKEMSVEEVFAEIKKDRHYYAASDGGVTLSGGECLLQADFCAALLKKCRAEKIHTAIESAFFTDEKNMEKVLPFVDFVFADLKIADPQKHRRYTGGDNKKIIENIRIMSSTVKEATIRIPVIPGVNDGEEDMEALGKIIGSFADGIKSVELLKYNILASSKYASLGKEYCSFGAETQSNEKMEILKNALRKIVKNIPVFFERS
ncbi:MAG: glycyl-radical enzyme activating protein [Candidatus Borkfalkiaceae bacterium]|nr:glycyl-radical enzyme activating protein [Clostridia bacterium]MDY6223131.1 glycyl-radical enzyme activating protein [Christensenellaceae bacterium]